MKKSIILIIIVTLITSCKKEKEKLPLPDISVIDISQETSWNYWVVSNQGDYYYVKKSSDNLPINVMLHSSKGLDIPIFFNEYGLPDKMVVDNYIYLFDNFNGTKVDICLVKSNGEINIARGVESNVNWDDLTLKSSGNWSDAIRIASYAIDGIPCAVSIAGSFTPAGFVIAPLAVWECTNYAERLISHVGEDYLNINNSLTDFLDMYNTANLLTSCSSPQIPSQALSCATGLASTALRESADAQQVVEQNIDDVRVGEAALFAGYGDIQITLTWDNTSDLDLHVFDPNNEEIWWNHRYSASGGILDYDDIDGYGPENVYWPTGQAPYGTYDVYVHDFVWDGKPLSANYTVLIQAFGRVKKFTGSISLDQTNYITSFDQNNLKSSTIKIHTISNSIKSK